ncbi:hypothetical protein KPH14_010753 [Odynerus spinipes]|uniref:Dynein axonemal assembly factor 1 homolog n=1 Tax=Odynerus spinipes TaxID=1348599 RepID=A0AAD9RV24_9HYME|nr:hypothetical protein KPH14_010753 [Odynerus spinipes]
MHQEDASIASKSILEPGIIDEELLVNLAIDQGPKGDAGKYFLEDGIKLDAITEIRIEFFSILNIDHLWVMPNLINLHLSNNIIEKIENLDSLVHLKELDLSFNHIKVLYLRKFKNLRSLNVARNPCTEKDGYQEYLIAFVPQLIYYQYKMITKETRQTAMDKHHRMISNIEEEETIKKKQLDAEKAFEDLQNLLSKSYIEYLNDDNFFWQMFHNDKEGDALSKVTSDTENAFEEYRKKISAICYEFYETGLREQARRDNEVKLFDVTVKDGKEKIQNNARSIVDETLDEKIKIFSQINELFSTVDDIEMDEVDDNIEAVQNFAIQLNDIMSKTWTKLMSKEVILHDQLVEINETFKVNMTNLIEQFLEVAREYFSQMRNAEAEYNDSINSIIQYYISGFGDESKIPSHLLNLCGDKDTLSNNLAASHDLHLRVIDAREDRMLRRLKTWLNEYCERLSNEEIKRHRQKILEISHFLQDLHKQFNSLISSYLPHLDIDNIMNMTNGKN